MSIYLEQAAIVALLTPIMEAEGKVFLKHKTIFARQAHGGERIETITTDGLETYNEAKPGDYIVTNRTEAGERYIISKTKFEQRYQATGQRSALGNEYRSTSQIKAVKITKTLLKKLGLSSPFYFETTWGEPMVAKMHDYLVMPIAAAPQVYRIAAKEFSETYSPVNQK